MNTTAIRAAALALALAGTWPSPARGQTYPITVTNNCSYAINVVGTPSNGTPYTPLPAGQSLTYNVTPPWNSGRVYGCWNDVTGHLDDAPTLSRNCGWVEITIPSSSGNISSNITYVDYIAIPMAISAQGGAFCVPSSARIATTFSESTVQQTCPTKLAPSLTSPANDKACMSQFHLCVDADGRPADPSCTLLDADIQTCTSDPTTYSGCAGGAGTSSPDVYGCRPTTFWSLTAGQAFCMAMNRGILSSWQNQGDPTKFYPASGTYNAYAAFVHGLPGVGPVFALPYDDYPSTLNEGGYVNCQSSTGYAITFCNSTSLARRLVVRGSATNGVAGRRDTVTILGRFAAPSPIDLSREKVVLERALSEGDAELVTGLGPGRIPFPLHLFRHPGSDADAAEFSSADGATPRAHLRIRAVRGGRFEFALAIRGADVSAPAACAGGASALLGTAFTLDASGVSVENEEPWSCGDGTLYSAER